MNGQINLVVFTEGDDNDMEAPIFDLLHNLSARPDIAILTVKTGCQALQQVTYKEHGNTAELSIPRPVNNLELSPFHGLLQMTYARRLADVLYPYLLNRDNMVCWSGSVNYLRVFEVLKAHYPNASFLYALTEWSWKRYLRVPDALFVERWKKGDSMEAPLAFELTAYEQRMAIIADGVVTASHHATAFFKQVLDISPDKITVIRNGMMLPGAQLKDKLQLRDSLGFNKEDKIILYTGDLTDGGGVFHLMAAFKKVVQEISNARLVIAGEGDYGRLLAQAKPWWSKIVLAGKVSSDALNKLILSADLGVIPALYGQYSGAAVKMQLLGLPVMISDADGLGEYFEDGEDSLMINVLVKEKSELDINIDQLAGKIISLLTDEALGRRLADTACKKAGEAFDINKMSAEYIRLFQKMRS